MTGATEKTPPSSFGDLARLDAALVSDARRFGHHGLAHFQETVRQRHNRDLTDNYAREVLARGGYPNPKP